jgi:translation initiation factor 1A
MMEERPAGEAETPAPLAAPENPPEAAAEKTETPLEVPPVQEGAASIEGGEGVGRLPLPRKDRGEIYGIANQLLGAARIRVMCEDNVSRMGRITGKLKKKMWIREGDLLILRPWGFQEGKADILFRYSRTQANYLSRRHLLPASLDLFGGEVPPEPPRRRH